MIGFKTHFSFVRWVLFSWFLTRRCLGWFNRCFSCAVVPFCGCKLKSKEVKETRNDSISSNRNAKTKVSNNEKQQSKSKSGDCCI